MKKFLLLTLMVFTSLAAFSQGVTTSSIRGMVSDNTDTPLIGVNIVVIHQPTGTFYGTSTDIDGSYRIDNMRVGGPYEVTASYVGYGDVVSNDIYLRLGEPYTHNIKMSDEALTLDEVVVVAKAGTTGKNSGSSTQISTEKIENMPTLNRNVSDYVKLTPQASTQNGGISFAGVNNRFNAIYIDGAVNNDVFGLSSSGTNGGQTGISPFSIDIIDQFQVVLSPYDVSLGGFAGGGINAVTKSGTNDIYGSAYYFFQNEDLVGKTNGKLIERLSSNSERTKVDEFSKSTYGASLGGPIAKNKAFFFINAEIQKDETPSPFDTELYTSKENRASEADLNNLKDVLLEKYGYDAGSFGSVSDELDGVKLFGKVDVNLNNENKLTLRHQYTKAEQYNRYGGSANTINFSNNGIYFPSTTNTSALELNSRLTNSISNNLIVGYTSVNDDRDPLGSPFPYVLIDDGNKGSIRFGSEPFSSANLLEQKIFTITDNLKIYRGKHTFTIGTHNEFYDIRNVFIPWNYGQYEFNSLEDFLNEAPADDFRRVYSLVDNVAGDESNAAAEFSAMQLGFYAQDEVEVTDKFTLTGGLRIDVPILSDDPEEAPRFNDEVLPKLQNSYDIANDVKAGQAPDGQIMLSPRLGFTYQVSRDNQFRGGIGIFTSRIPFVWPGAMYNNNGLTTTFLGAWGIDGDVLFRPNVQNQYTFENPTTPSGDMNLFTNDFKYPQVLRGNLAYDTKLGNGWSVSVEGMYTKTLNNVLYTNINTSKEVAFTWTNNGDDDRRVFERSELDEDDFGAVYVASNTSEGYSYNLTASIAKSFDIGFDFNLSYSYNDAYALTEGTSSQNSSQWRGQVHIDDRNDPVYGRSDFSVGHRVVSGLSYRFNWTSDENFGTTISLFYNGQSGNPFSYVIANRSAQNIANQRGSTSRNRSLVYVPKDINDINLVDYELSDGTVVTAEEQWNNLNAVIEDDSHLSSRRGEYAEKNASRVPWASYLDLAIRQDIGSNIGGYDNKLQISFDIFNLANLLNKDWGVRYNVPGDYNNYFLYEFEGYEADGTTPKFTFSDEGTGKDRFNISNLSSRWSMRVGLRYIFGN